MKGPELPASLVRVASPVLAPARPRQHRIYVHMRHWAITAVFVVVCSTLFLSGCGACSPRQNPDELRERTAQATATIKQDAKAMAQGIREGLSRNDVLDLNSASAKDLSSLPGISEDKAQAMVRARPYAIPGDLVTKRVLTKREYDRIKDRVTVKK